MSTDPIMTKAMAEAARLIQSVLTAQAPRKTGRLRDSIKVLPTTTKSGNLSLVSSYEEYGVFLDYGTGPFNTYPRRGVYRANPGSGVGRGGILPRYWTSLSASDRQRVTQILKEAAGKLIRFELKRVKLK